MSADDESALEERVAADIAGRGFHLGLVPAEGGTPGWAFSIGLAERFGHPELVAFAPDPEFAGGLVENLAMRVLRGQRFDAAAPAASEVRVPGILGEHEVCFRPVDRKWVPVFLGNVAWHYREGGPRPRPESQPVPVLQCFWPDRGGRFPWEMGFDPEWVEDQPLLHHHETHRALSERLVATLRKEGAL